MEQRAALSKGVQHLTTRAGGRLGRHHRASVGLEQPGQVLPQHEGDRRAARGRLARPAWLAGGGIFAVGSRIDN